MEIVPLYVGRGSGVGGINLGVVNVQFTSCMCVHVYMWIYVLECESVYKFMHEHFMASFPSSPSLSLFFSPPIVCLGIHTLIVDLAFAHGLYSEGTI